MDNTQKMGFKNWTLIWILGMAGQICWNIENQWFNTFVYKEIAPDPSIISWMVAISAIMTAFSTFFFGTLSDRLGTRKPFVSFGYILWGIFTIVFGLTMYIPSSKSGSIMLIATLVVISDAIMSFCGSMGNDSGFNAWTSDLLNDSNRGGLGAALAAQPVLGTIIGTVVGGMIIVSFGYMIFFLVMGIFVILIGILALFFMKDSKTIKKRVEGSFWHQFAEAFKFKEFFKLKELVWVNIIITVFFIGFNVYFVHIGNIFIYSYGFTEDIVGYIQGVGLVIAILFTIPGIKLINKDKSPILLAITFIIDIVGLLVLYLFGAKANPNEFISSTNLPLIIGIILVGIGYVITLQTTTVWGKKLYPQDAKGQFEGIRIIFFVLIPMIVGPLIANPIIEATGKPFVNEYNIEGLTPNENLFLAAAILCVLTYIPLYFASKYHNNRIKLEKKES